MENKLVSYFKKIMPLTEDEANAIADSIVVKNFKKGTVLLTEGQISTECYFVLEGLVRQYYLVDGEEVTNNFFSENQWVISIDSFSQQKPANHFFVCEEDTSLVVGNEERENEMYNYSQKFETISRKVMESIVIEQQQQMMSYITDSPEERYLKLQNSRPDLLNRVPQYQLASYIGVKPESLSRIKKRITPKKGSEA